MQASRLAADIQIIDAHQYFWFLPRGDYCWLTPSQGALYRDYLPSTWFQYD